jgi:L-lactate dehydrogenase (cytochrome)
VMAGRAYLYGLGAAGERGVDHVLGLLDDDVRRTMALLGAPTIDDLGRHVLAPDRPTE